jgi:Uma2 family endonuclease
METSPRPRSKLTYAEYERIPEDGKRHEILDGEHHVNPAPGTYHQTVSRRIQFQLYEQIELTGRGQVFNAPIDVELSRHDIVQPDLAVVLEERRAIITPTRIEGAPDLIVEILSPSTSQIDRVLKKELYRRAGVPEYWVVDPEGRTVEQYSRVGERYELAGTHASAIASLHVPRARVDLVKVW